jgi:hypothetical protein
MAWMMSISEFLPVGARSAAATSGESVEAKRYRRTASASSDAED